MQVGEISPWHRLLSPARASGENLDAGKILFLPPFSSVRSSCCVEKCVRDFSSSPPLLLGPPFWPRQEEQQCCFLQEGTTWPRSGRRRRYCGCCWTASRWTTDATENVLISPPAESHFQFRLSEHLRNLTRALAQRPYANEECEINASSSSSFWGAHFLPIFSYLPKKEKILEKVEQDQV